LEDLHWVDNSTLDVISVLARRRVPAKLVVLSDHRPADVIIFAKSAEALKQDFAGPPSLPRNHVERLEEADVASIWRWAFADSDFPSGLAELIHRNSGGTLVHDGHCAATFRGRGSLCRKGEMF